MPCIVMDCDRVPVTTRRLTHAGVSVRQKSIATLRERVCELLPWPPGGEFGPQPTDRSSRGENDQTFRLATIILLGPDAIRSLATLTRGFRLPHPTRTPGWASNQCSSPIA